MDALARVPGHEHHELNAGWELAASAPDAHATPAQLDALRWADMTVPGTAAGALRDAGLWTHGDGRDFDAEDWWFRTRFSAEPATDWRAGGARARRDRHRRGCVS